MENTDVKTGAAPSAPLNAQEVLNKMTADERSKWRQTGEIPQPKNEAPAASDAQKETATSEGKPESAPAPDAGKETAQEKGSRRKPEAEERISKLIAENKRLQRELESKTSETKTAETSPAKSEEPKKLEAPKKPNLEEFQKQGKTWEDFEEARDKYFEDLADYKAKLAVEQDRQNRAFEEAQRTLKQQLAEAKQRYTDYEEVISPAAKELQGVHPAVAAIINSSSVFADLVYAIGGDAQELVEQSKSDPIGAARRVFEIEKLVKEELGKKSAPKTEDKQTQEAPRNDKGQFQSPEKKITSAPRPPAEVSGTATVEDDAVKAALAKRDFSAYRREMNRREMARK